ncbi:unnamed protein product, partial [Rhizoctonia solani]
GTFQPLKSHVAFAFSGALFGFSSILLFLPLSGYVVEAYPVHTASVTTLTTICCSTLGTRFLPFGAKTYEAWDLSVASTIFELVAVAMAFIPISLKLCGASVRRKAEYVYHG